jgi:cysteinyl-tRNA synthetase
MVVNASIPEEAAPSGKVIALAEERVSARSNKNWAESDKLRDEISALGWTVQDSKDGYKLVKN